MATEKEQGFEEGDPSAQQMSGFFEDDDEDTEDFTGEQEDESDPFTTFEQFDRYETADDLLHALNDASEVARKIQEEKVKAGGRMPREEFQEENYL